MLDRSALRDFRPLIMTPSHDGTFFFTYLASTIQLMADASNVGLPINYMFQCGDSLVTRARNHLVAIFLSQPQWTHLMWIDADIGFSPEAFYRLLLADRDIAAGVYPLKRENWPAEGVPAGTTETDYAQLYTRYTANSGQAADPIVGLHIDEDGFMAVREAPTGFMLIKRDVFLRMIDAYPELKYTPDMIDAGPAQYSYLFFDVSLDPESNRYLSEDYTFCRRWEKMGGKIYVDANSNLAHMGGKIYRGDFAASLTRNAPWAVTAPAGKEYQVSGLEHLKSNPPGPV